MSVTSRLRRIERELGVGHDIRRTFLILGSPKREGQTPADSPERRANIDRAIQKAIRRDLKCPFFFLLT